MLTEEEARKLSNHLERLSCIDSKAGDGLFGFVILGEQGANAAQYERHVAECEYCKTALQLYRYKRDAMKLFKKWESGKKVVSAAEAPGTGILKKKLGYATGYFQPGDKEGRGTSVVVDAAGDFLSVEECSLDEFHRLRDVTSLSSRFAFLKLPFRWFLGFFHKLRAYYQCG